MRKHVLIDLQCYRTLNWRNSAKVKIVQNHVKIKELPFDMNEIMITSCSPVNAETCSNLICSAITCLQIGPPCPCGPKPMEPDRGKRGPLPERFSIWSGGVDPDFSVFGRRLTRLDWPTSIPDRIWWLRNPVQPGSWQPMFLNLAKNLGDQEHCHSRTLSKTKRVLDNVFLTMCSWQRVLDNMFLTWEGEGPRGFWKKWYPPIQVLTWPTAA